MRSGMAAGIRTVCGERRYRSVPGSSRPLTASTRSRPTGNTGPRFLWKRRWRWSHWNPAGVSIRKSSACYRNGTRISNEAIQREAGTKDDVAGTLGNIANVLDGQGDLAGARKMQEEGLRNFRAVADKRGVSSTLSNLGALLREQGDLAGAKSYYEQALAMVTETGYRKGRGYALMGLGQIALARGDLGDARQKIEESLSLRVEMGDEFNAASSRVALANVAVEEGRLADASAGLRKAVEVFHKAKAGDNESEACAGLARVLAAEGNRSEALAAVRRAKVLQLGVSDFALRFVVMIAEARVPADSATAALNDARERLQSALDEAIQHGYQIGRAHV